MLGPLRLERAYYHCDRCQGGFCPRDRALRLEPFSLTPGVLRMTGSAAALVSFAESSSLLHELAGVKVSISQVQRAAETLGEAIAADDLEIVSCHPEETVRASSPFWTVAEIGCPGGRDEDRRVTGIRRGFAGGRRLAAGAPERVRAFGHCTRKPDAEPALVWRAVH